jgi:Lysyl oxidase
MLATLGTKRAVVLLCAVAAATLMVVLVVVAASKPAGAATDRLPDLGMAKLTNIQIQNTNGHRLLRFDTKIVNIGAGAFEARGSRPATSTPTMRVKQRIYNNAGGHRDVSTAAKMYYSGDGHDHWHLRNLETYTLTRLDNGVKVGTGAKEGFCFFDNYRFGARGSKHYGPGCANGRPGALSVTTGLSRGWGDIYSWNKPGQYINITGLANRAYRLRATADTGGWFKEQKEKNNSTYADIRIKGSRVSVIRYGPSARPISG